MTDRRHAIPVSPGDRCDGPRPWMTALPWLSGLQMACALPSHAWIEVSSRRGVLRVLVRVAIMSDVV